MKTYTITVNGTVYSVTVEEGASTGAAPVAAAPVAAAPAPAAKAAPAAPAPAAPAPAAPAKTAGGAAGSVEINAPMPGKILDVKAQLGASVSRGDVVLVLEAMKMENEVVAPQDGTIASINVNVGDMVEPGAVLATMN